MALMPPLLPMMAGGVPDSSETGAALDIGIPSVWLQFSMDRFTGRYVCNPLHKTPGESFAAGIYLPGITGGGDVSGVSIAYSSGHGLTFSSVAVVYGGSISAAFLLSGGRRNTRHVLVITVTTADDIYRIHCPIVVVR